MSTFLDWYMFYIYCCVVDSSSELLKYKELLDADAITQEEYDAKKKELLNLSS